MITLAETSPGMYQSDPGQPKSITYQQFIPGYQFIRQQSKNYFLPVLQLKGRAVLDNQTTSQITAFLPLIQE